MGGGHRTSKFDHIFTLGWGHRTKYLFKKIHMVGRVVLSDLPDSQLGCESKMEPSVAISITRWNLPDSHLCLKSKTEPCVANAPNYIGGGTPHILY